MKKYLFTLLAIVLLAAVYFGGLFTANFINGNKNTETVQDTSSLPETTSSLETTHVPQTSEVPSSGQIAQTESTENGDQVIHIYKRDSDDTFITLYADGRATSRVDPSVEIWTDYADPNAGGEEGAEGRKREATYKNMITDRPIPSNNNKIADAFILPTSPSIPGGEAKAVIKCENNIYYYIDLTGSENEGITPVILQEFEQLRGKAVTLFEFRTDTVVNESFIKTGNDYIYAILENGQETEVWRR